MAATAALCAVGHNRLRYLITATGTGLSQATITCTGAASPDLITDSVAGPIKNLAKAEANGYGQITPGSLTNGEVRALWLSDNSSGEGPEVAGNHQMPTAICRVTPRAAADVAVFDVTAAQDGSGHAIIQVLCNLASNITATAYLDVEVPGAIGA